MDSVRSCHSIWIYIIYSRFQPGNALAFLRSRLIWRLSHSKIDSHLPKHRYILCTARNKRISSTNHGFAEGRLRRTSGQAAWPRLMPLFQTNRNGGMAFSNNRSRAHWVSGSFAEWCSLVIIQFHEKQTIPSGLKMATVAWECSVASLFPWWYSMVYGICCHKERKKKKENSDKIGFFMHILACPSIPAWITSGDNCYLLFR